MASIRMPTSLTDALKSMHISQLPCSWTLQNSGKAVTVILTWQSEKGSSNRAMNCPGIPAVSGSGLSPIRITRKPPSKLRRDKQRLLNFLTQKRNEMSEMDSINFSQVSGSPVTSELFFDAIEGRDDKSCQTDSVSSEIATGIHNENTLVSMACQTELLVKVDRTTNTAHVLTSAVSTATDRFLILRRSVGTYFHPDCRSVSLQTTRPDVRSVGCQHENSADKNKMRISQVQPKKPVDRPPPAVGFHQQDRKQCAKVTSVSTPAPSHEIVEILSCVEVLRTGTLSYNVRYADGCTANVGTVPSKFPRPPGWP